MFPLITGNEKLDPLASCSHIRFNIQCKVSAVHYWSEMVTYLCVKIGSSSLERLWDATRPTVRAMFVDIKPSTALNSENSHHPLQPKLCAASSAHARGLVPPTEKEIAKSSDKMSRKVFILVFFIN